MKKDKLPAPGVEIIDIEYSLSDVSPPVLIHSVEQLKECLKTRDVGIFYPSRYLIDRKYLGVDGDLDAVIEGGDFRKEKFGNFRFALETRFRLLSSKGTLPDDFKVELQWDYGNCFMVCVIAHQFSADIVVDKPNEKKIEDIALFVFQQFMFCLLRSYGELVDKEYKLKEMTSKEQEEPEEWDDEREYNRKIDADNKRPKKKDFGWFLMHESPVNSWGVELPSTFIHKNASGKYQSYLRNVFLKGQLVSISEIKKVWTDWDVDDRYEAMEESGTIFSLQLEDGFFYLVLDRRRSVEFFKNC